MQTFDLEQNDLRTLNATLHAQKTDTNQTAWNIINPRGSHAIAVGLDAPIEVTVNGSTGYYCAGMNQQAKVKQAPIMALAQDGAQKGCNRCKTGIQADPHFRAFGAYGPPFSCTNSH